MVIRQLVIVIFSLAASLQLMKHESCRCHVIMQLNVMIMHLVQKRSMIMAESSVTGDNDVNSTF